MNGAKVVYTTNNEDNSINFNPNALSLPVKHDGMVNFFFAWEEKNTCVNNQNSIKIGNLSFHQYSNYADMGNLLHNIQKHLKSLNKYHKT